MKIAVLVSGGVDSSVALALLQQQGHDVTAFYLKIWLEDELAYLGECPWQEDLSYAEAICKQLNVPLHVVSFQQDYWQEVVAYVIEQVKSGYTPNPDIMCNKRVKFGAFLQRFGSEFDLVASGHYARVEINALGETKLLCSPDEIKDQTYFLSHVPSVVLKRLLFPIGHLTKQALRAHAESLRLATAGRADSQGICFLGNIKFRDFIKHHVGERSGEFIEIETKKKVGIHNGFWFYTTGQRQGLGLAGGPWYVVCKDHERNIVYISRNYHASDKKRDSCIINNVNWFSGNPPRNSHDLTVKLRHGAHRHACTIAPLDDGQRFLIRLATRDQGIAPGQFAVLYQKDECLGGGVIEHEHANGR